jgi:glycosyltransferase involved in cell wall biosynthesis
LIVAEHASAKFGGEALIPFQYFKYLRQLDIDVHLLVHDRTRGELCESFPNDIERLHFVSDSRINVLCARLGRSMPDRLRSFTLGAASHFDTQFRQRRMAKSLIKRHRFDLVHEPIPVSPKLPSMMFGLGVPVVIGPMNGGMDYPPHYNLAGPIERVTISLLRWTSTFWNVIAPGKRNAALILVANKRTYDALPFKVKHRKIIETVENGVDLDRFNFYSDKTIGAHVNIMYLGRLVDWKRVDLLVDACVQLIGKLQFKLHIVGDGPLRGDLEIQVKNVGLAAYVRFHGFLPQATAADLLRKSDIMVLPSMRECGGAVVLEAMASGVPVIAAKWGGPADYISDESGILIMPGEPAEFKSKLADAIIWLANNTAARIKMVRAARQRVEQFYDWRVKAETLLRLYETVVEAEHSVIL